MNTSPNTWFVTGASKGLGLALVKALLAHGQNVAATSRTRASLESIQTEGKAGQLLPLEVDLSDADSVQRAVDATVTRFGRLDVLVNNAGYGQQGTLEAMSDAEVRRNFEINVFAPINVLRQALPHMRRQRSGHVINIASIVGFQGGYAGWGSYVATKFALAGLTETLAAETAELGIKATVVYPGPVRTDFLSSGSLMLAARSIADYTEAQASLDLHLDSLAGQQAGDPERLALLIMQAAAVEKPPLHLFAGRIACHLAQQKMNTVTADLDAWRAASMATDFAA
ncbi:SDR family NAD(P)-dependent oxidoreductase [Herbaspirillum lusitanum]|uniref:SDR family NAD(P)-dependent oxidoreductase n=1 Tax=Herbaspirillum lusitanum TaxID=213312 RepID=A0ABW9A9T7_9BURK